MAAVYAGGLGGNQEGNVQIGGVNSGRSQGQNTGDPGDRRRTANSNGTSGGTNEKRAGSAKIAGSEGIASLPT
jgi:hypothetical protein